MCKQIIYIVIYIAGCIISYSYFKKEVAKKYRYQTFEKVFNITMSVILSWVWLLINSVAIKVDKDYN